MSGIEKLNKDFESAGFVIKDDTYILDKVEYNGGFSSRKYVKLVYAGEGCEIGDSDSDIDETEFYEFDVINGDKSVATICIGSFDELKEYINI